MKTIVTIFDRVGAWAYGLSDFQCWTLGGFAVVAVCLASLAIGQDSRRGCR